MRRNDYSRDETEWGAFGDAFGATIAARSPAAISATLSRPIVAAPTAKAAVAAVAKPAAVVAAKPKAAPATNAQFQTALLTLKPMANIATRVAPSAALKAVSAIQLPTPKPAAPSVSSSGSSVDPRTLDFTTGQTNLSATGGVKAAIVAPVVLTADQQYAANAARIRADVAKTSVINQQYTRDRAAADQASLVQNNEIAALPIMHAGSGAWNFAGQDWGLIPLGAKVLATGAAVIATAGTAGAAIAAGGITAASIGSVVTADGIVAAAAQAGGKKAQEAKAVIDGTKRLAAGGDIDAQKGLATIAAVTADRAQKAVPVGVLQTPAQLAGLAANPVIQEATAGGALTVTDSGRRQPFVSQIPADVLAQAAKPFANVKPSTRPVFDPFATQVLRWTVDSGGKVYRGASPLQLAGESYRVYDSGQVQKVG